MKRLITALFLSFLLISPVWAANDVDTQGNIITITTIDGTDWTWTDSYPDAVNGLYIYCIMFHPGATGDIITGKLEDTNGPEIFYFNGADVYDQRIMYFPKGIPYKLFLDLPDINDNALIMIHLR